MKIEMVNLQEIKPYEKNPRKNKGAIEKVAKSIEEFGFKVPIILDKNNVIVAGHTRYLASQNLELENVPCVYADDLTDQQIKAFRIADNRVAEFSYWDNELLVEELDELENLGFDVDLTGFNLFDVEKMKFGMDDDDLEDLEDDEEQAQPEGNQMIIQYNIVFNTEEEQKIWHDFLLHLKNKYQDVDTIAERLVLAIKEFMKNE